MTRIGDPVARLDGPAKVTGAARYAADHHLDGQLHAVLVGAPVPAGRVTGIDRRAALAVPGVVAVLVAGDLPPPAAGFAQAPIPPLATRHVPVQDNRILYHGQPVAIVVADSLEAAEEAATRVTVSIEPAPFTVPDTAPIRTPSLDAGYAQLAPLDVGLGDLAAAVRSSAVTVTGTYTQPARHNNPMEPSAILAVWAGDRLTVYDSVQHVFGVRATLAAVFGVDADRVRVISHYTGGGFGAKAYVWPHEILAAMTARVLRRPIKLVLTRAQMYSIVGYQPLMEHEVTLAARGDGTLTGIRHDVVNTTALTEDYVEFGSVTAGALFAAPSITLSQRVRRGNVNLPTFLRSPIDGPGTWALGAAMDELARATGIDPIDLRLINHADREPSTGKPWSSKKLVQAYGEGARRFGWRTRPRGGTRDGDWRIGCGLADATQGQFRFPARVRLRMDLDGRLTLEGGFADIGQGPHTVFPQIAGSVLGLAPDEIRTRTGDSSLPAAPPSYGSATTIGVGAAVLDGATRLRDCLAELAGWHPSEVHCADGELRRGTDAVAVTRLLSRHGTPLVVDGSFVLPGGAEVDAGPSDVAVRTFGVVLVEVGVDPDLGLVRLRRATGGYAAGRIVNIRTARAQMIGGIVWGWGKATMEASHFEPKLGRWHAQNLSGVSLPVNADIPPLIDVAFVDEYDDRAGPLGAKGIGELSATGVAAAVANAVFDAVGVRVRDLPITPAKILRG
ncbi:xanthine dehydrogenase family protein molybdopterin-binding subunit [Micromonospora sp. NBC_01796]|uniref:xanthine dehydrogenase family protein molybdopterin-binding subunit n=1 Tax=Micromonospora sp. NBC_01796 TaxID=2975987 RepID=UPI002DD96FA2|nr:xanthine dehydrogenase family protein molybdopterin-binding subunit [Micromonospora sp. NBC_01796]WSA84835.1 xanthine dehydrogenase family protein molybdopterin-binding subunit [Micromonospora sp. NBC_01796]